MTRPADERVARWLVDLGTALDTAASLARRGEQAFRSDPALPLAFEALSNRVGDLSKRLATADPVRFSEPIWSQAARNRDFVVHHCGRIDTEALWITVTVTFPELRQALRRA
jgi:uncharacterized protein with HEPN domain